MVFDTAGGDLRYWFFILRLAVFQFLKSVVPGAFFAKDFSVVLYFRAAGLFGLRFEDDSGVLQLELEGFVRVIRVFDEKIKAAANGTFHNKKVQGLRFKVQG